MGSFGPSLRSHFCLCFRRLRQRWLAPKSHVRHTSWAELPWIQLQGPLPEFDSDEEKVLFLPEQAPVESVAEHEAQRDAGVDLQLHHGVDPSEGCDINVPSEAGWAPLRGLFLSFS